MKNSFLFFLFCSFFAPKLLALQGGTELKKDDPLRLSVVRVELGNGGCTGTLVSLDKVLTARHCVDEVNRVSSFKRGFSISMKVTEVHYPEDAGELYGEDCLPLRGGGCGQYDLALLTLEEAFPESFKPLPVFTTKEEKQNLKIVGAGLENSREAQRHPPLKSFLGGMLTTPFRWDSELEDMYSYCVPGQEVRSLPGDSGGPLLAERNGEWGIIGTHVSSVEFWDRPTFAHCKGSAFSEFVSFTTDLSFEPLKNFLLEKLGQ